MGNRHFWILSSALLLIIITSQFGSAQTTTFTYQGKLSDSGNPANGSYDLQFTLWDALSGGTQQPQPGPITVSRNAVNVAGGIFTVQLDFTVNAFPGADRFLQISVRPAGVGSFATLSPRQQISSTPYAIRTLSAAVADTAANAMQLGGVAANQYVQTNDARLSDSRPPTAGSSNYIQNTTTTQASANFNIAGIGTANTLTGNLINATTQYNLAGTRFLSAAGTLNTFAGINAGQANTTGQRNAFFGTEAGFNNTSGTSNTFFGSRAGRSNTTVGGNSFFGDTAGFFNSGGGNSYFGASAGEGGFGGASGSSNSFFGYLSGQFNTTAANNSFFGAQSGQFSTGNNNSFFGTLAGANNTGDGNSFFGNGAGQFNTNGISNSFFGSQAGMNNSSGTENAFFGSGAGQFNVTEANNTFLGSRAGAENGTGDTNNVASNNTFVGTAAGASNRTEHDNTFIGFGAGDATGLHDDAGTANENTFVGSSAGSGNFTGQRNSFFGSEAGEFSSSGSFNNFFGSRAGMNTGTGYENNMFGEGAGLNNSSGAMNSFFGDNAGLNSLGDENSFFGSSAGSANVNGTNNAAFGSHANVGSGGLNHATAIGSGAIVSSNNTIMLGRSFVDNVVVGNRLTVQVIPDGGSFANQVCFDAPGNLLRCTSSLRYKTNVRSFSDGLNTLRKLRPISFNWKESGERDVGLGAEEVAKVAPFFVSTNTKGEIVSVKYTQLSALFINAFQEQQKEIEQAKLRNIQQQNQIQQQQRKIDELRSLVCADHRRARMCRKEVMR